MGKLALSVAIGDYDRTRPLIDGSVQIDGVDPVIMTLSPEEIFFRAFRDAPFDICELSLSSFTVKTAAGGPTTIRG
jgi:4,5-dihydroxyphthalate decarboxylase